MAEWLEGFLIKTALVLDCIITLIYFSFISLAQYETLSQLWEQLLQHYSYSTLILLSFVPYVLAVIYRALFQQYIYERKLSELPEPPPAFESRIKHCGEVLPPYPNGWFMLAESGEVKKGKVLRKQAIGKEFAIYRGEDGQVRILSAFCPHLGANLAVCGKVKKNCLVCPFHGWSFNGEGKCVDIPGASNIPKQAETKSYICEERNNMVLIWYHSDDEPPSWHFDTLPQFARNGLFQSSGYTKHEVSCHIQEVPENGPDVAHLNVVHSPFIVKLFYILGFTHVWDAKWYACQPPQSHIAKIDIFETMYFLGYPIPGTRLNIKVSQVGPGLVYLEFTTWFGRLLLMQNVTPIGPMLQECRHNAYVETWRIPLFVGKLLLFSLKTQFERDTPIWNNKTYLRTPCLSSADGPIKQFRRWFSQFYTPEDLELAKSKSVLEW